MDFVFKMALIVLTMSFLCVVRSMYGLLNVDGLIVFGVGRFFLFPRFKGKKKKLVGGKNKHKNYKKEANRYFSICT